MASADSEVHWHVWRFGPTGRDAQMVPYRFSSQSAAYTYRLRHLERGSGPGGFIRQCDLVKRPDGCDVTEGPPGSRRPD